MLAVTFAVPVSAGDEGKPSVGVQIQNLESGDIDITALSYPQDGSTAEALGGKITLKGETATTYYLPDFPLKAGSSALVVSSTGLAGGIARTEWDSSTGAGIYSTTAPGTKVLMPIILSGFTNQTSQVSVQNTDQAASISDVKLTLLPRGGGTPVVVDKQTIPAGTSKTWKLDDTSVWGNLPDNATDLGAKGFMGSMVIESATPLVVQSFIDVNGTPAISAFTGVAADSAANKLYCPLARDNYYGNTGITIVNNNGSEANVDITFRADPKSPNSNTVTQNIKVGANSSNIAFQGPTGNTRTAGMPGGTQTASNTVPTNDGWFGSAEINSNQAVVAIVNDTLFGPAFSIAGQSSYNCAPAAKAGKKHFLPLLRRYHLADQKLVSGVQVVNVTGGNNKATLSLVNWDGTDAPDPAAQTIGPNSAVNFYGGDWTGLPTVPPNLGGSGWFGSGVITCDADCIVLVNDEHVTGIGTKAVDRANYIGITQ
jgi:hypothetical protein